MTQFWIEFLQLYKEQPCLWDKSCNDFKNKAMKNLAYSVLLEKFWEVDATATVTTVVNKIKNFHRSYIYHRNKNEIESRAAQPVAPWFYKPYLDFYYEKYAAENIGSNSKFDAGISFQSDPDDSSSDSTLLSDIAARKRSSNYKHQEKSSTNVQSDIEDIIGNEETLTAEMDSIGIIDNKKDTEDQTIEERHKKKEEDEEEEQAVNSILFNYPEIPKPEVDLLAKFEKAMAKDQFIVQENINDVETEDQAFEISDDDEPPNKRLCQILSADVFETQDSLQSSNYENAEVGDTSSQVREEVVTRKTVPNNNECVKFAAYLATKMRSFNPAQKYIAQKLIGDVISLASSKQLGLNSCIEVDRKT